MRENARAIDAAASAWVVTQPADIVPALRRGIHKTQEGIPVMLEFITERAVDLSLGW
jgi:glyoxylate carboligase